MTESFLDACRADDDHSRKCDLSKAMERMEPSFLAEVREAMASSDVTAAAIARTLQRFDYVVTEGSVRRCRRICNCWRADAA